MPAFGKASEAQLATCHPDLVRVARLVVVYFDITIMEGHRGKEAQNAAFAEGNSKTSWPLSKHNKTPSLAFDVYPYPVDFSDNSKNLQRFMYMHGMFEAEAQRLGINLRHGVDWNDNGDMRDEPTFRDYPHIELVLP